ncbi:uncharacterized protein I303_108701 [Kwoniella dejecticola CBS 10117]|uniref:Uncharacterized protein n=1 Tax=Kwoniella dejecticola CBS 10117 TaxID=1296121 RepID=A0A1A5ZWN3_9TREE|nr:uncharacterized protein I303_06974 [Kwoniella dejecticola CBS 10117]OBR82215.1 hypothetical protein I303_06974 [Kwoniella dejecticola CBS 10117]
MHDPQQLSFLGSINALLALGRIPLASEVPLWTTFGCILAARLFPSTGAEGLLSIDWWVVFQCAFTTWATNVSINYGNEYFDWNLDRPGQVESIKRAIKVRQQKERGEVKEEEAREINEKIMGNTTRIIHDGTFPPYTALLLGAAWQAAVVALIFYSRSQDSSLCLQKSNITGKPHRSGAGSPYKGFALQIGIVSSVLSQMYVGPPIRLHYHGLGELVSALLLNPITILWGMTGYYSATTDKTVHISDIFYKSTSGFSLGPLWILLAAMYCFEQARIFIMHIQDIEADIAGGKITFVVRVGHRIAARLYVVFNVLALLLFGLFTKYTQSRSLGTATLHSQSVSQGWIQGLSVVLLYSIPIMIITAKSLFASIPPHRLTQPTKGLLPALPLTYLPAIVSLQVLLSPIVLSVFTLIHW